MNFERLTDKVSVSGREYKFDILKPYFQKSTFSSATNSLTHSSPTWPLLIILELFHFR